MKVASALRVSKLSSPPRTCQKSDYEKQECLLILPTFSFVQHFLPMLKAVPCAILFNTAILEVDECYFLQMWEFVKR